jgi:hypothetical protein
LPVWLAVRGAIIHSCLRSTPERIFIALAGCGGSLMVN